MSYKAVISNDGYVQYIELDGKPSPFRVEFDPALAKWKRLVEPEDLSGLELEDTIKDDIDKRQIANSKARSNWDRIKANPKRSLPGFISDREPANNLKGQLGERQTL